MLVKIDNMHVPTNALKASDWTVRTQKGSDIFARKQASLRRARRCWLTTTIPATMQHLLLSPDVVDDRTAEKTDNDSSRNADCIAVEDLSISEAQTSTTIIVVIWKAHSAYIVLTEERFVACRRDFARTGAKDGLHGNDMYVRMIVSNLHWEIIFSKMWKALRVWNEIGWVVCSRDHTRVEAQDWRLPCTQVARKWLDREVSATENELHCKRFPF